MVVKMKLCAGSCGSVKVIWKNIGGKKYCKDCARSIQPEMQTKINPVSKIRAKRLRIYSVLRDNFLKNYPDCTALFEGCTGVSSEVHHSGGRENESLIDDSSFVALCHSCHSKITTESALAIALGLSKSRHKKAS